MGSQLPDLLCGVTSTPSFYYRHHVSTEREGGGVMADDMDDDAGVSAMREIVSHQQRIQLRRYTSILAKVDHTPAIDMMDPPTCDEYGTMTIGTWGGYHVQVMPMLFNDRLVLTPMTATWGYDHGWCYDKGGAAFLAALVWNPSTEAEPAGYKKRATAGERKAGEIAPAGDRQWMGEALIALLEGRGSDRGTALAALLAADGATR